MNTPDKKPDGGETVDAHIYLPKAEYEELKRIAQANDRSITGQVRFYLKRAMLNERSKP